MRILILAGSARRDSFNEKIAAIASEIAAELGAEVDHLKPAELPLPIFDQDLEASEGMPANAKAIKQRFLQADALILACPEYNSGITPLLKNIIDWVSRSEDDNELPLSAYRGKVAGLLAASPGALGGLRGLVQVRSILSNIGVIVVPKQHALSGASDKFDEQGKLKDDKQLKAVRSVVEEVYNVTRALKGA